MMNWSADAELQKQALEIGMACFQKLKDVFDAQTVPAEGSNEFDRLLELCHTAGTLYYLGQEAETGPWRTHAGANVIGRALASWSADDLQRAYIHFLALSRKLPAASLSQENMEETKHRELFDDVIACLQERERAQRILKGAAVLLGSEPQLQENVSDLLVIFDNAIRENLHFFIPMNEHRRNRVNWAHPDRAEDFWWWKQGFEFPQDALISLFRAAEIVRSLPGARAFFETLCKIGDEIDRQLQRHPQKRQTTPVTLRERLQSKAPAEPAAAAAKNQDEIPTAIVENEHFGLVVEDTDTLTVFFKRPYDESRDRFSFLPAAYIEIPGESRHILPVDQKRGVFATFRLSHPLFDRLRGTLWVQCVDEQISFQLESIPEK